jgi:anti-sigma regulatory factor (Ser/Thr protein kinase)
MTIAIPSDTGYLQFLAAVTREFTRKALDGMPDVDEQFYFNIELVMTEAVVNAIRHAYDGRKGPVELTMDWADHRLAVKVSEYGTPFTDFDAYAAREIDELDPLSTSGRGIIIIRSLMDHVHYSTDRQTGRNELTMIKTFPRPDTPGSHV